MDRKQKGSAAGYSPGPAFNQRSARINNDSIVIRMVLWWLMTLVWAAQIFYLSTSPFRAGVSESLVAEMLASALYQMFTLDDEGAVRLRSATYHIWQQTHGERRRTMRLLSGEETDLVQFNQAFLKVLALAVRQTLQASARSWRWQQTGRTLKRLGELLAWLAAGNLSGLLRTTGSGGVR